MSSTNINLSIEADLKELLLSFCQDHESISPSGLFREKVKELLNTDPIYAEKLSRLKQKARDGGSSN
jgi:hypothetical protein